MLKIFAGKGARVFRKIFAGKGVRVFRKIFAGRAITLPPAPPAGGARILAGHAHACRPRCTRARAGCDVRVRVQDAMYAYVCAYARVTRNPLTVARSTPRSHGTTFMLVVLPGFPPRT